MTLVRALILTLCLLAPAARAQYVVQPGDTLSVIAEKTLGSGGRWREIARLNELPEPYVIQPGQRLKIPGAADLRPSPPPPPPPPAPAPGDPEAEAKARQINANMVSNQERVFALLAWLFTETGFVILVFLYGLVHVPFYAVGAKFGLFLFKQEIGWRRSLGLGFAWTFLPAVFALFLPTRFEREPTEGDVWLLVSVAGVSVVSMIWATGRIVQCGIFKSIVVMLLGWTFAAVLGGMILFWLLVVISGLVAVSAR